MARAARLLALLGVLGSAAPLDNSNSSSVKVSWIGDAPSQNLGTTFGLPWPQGKYRPGEVAFQISDGQNSLPLQSWVTGYWRDGSIKWSAHAIPRTDKVADEYTIEATPVSKRTHNTKRTRQSQTAKLSVVDGSKEVTVDTGKITVSFPKQGRYLVSSIKTSGGKTVGRDGKLVLYSQNGVPETADDWVDAKIERYKFESKIEEVTVTKNGGNDVDNNNNDSVRALVTVRGSHTAVANGSSAHGDWLPFVVRFYLYADSDAIRLLLPRAVYPSAGGGDDEYIPIHVHERRVPRERLAEWSGKLTGPRDQGEKITLKLVRMRDLWRERARDAKCLAAVAL
ncbi:hypothetical protein VTH06DRAFT_8737 [Thermothelomyces fergusii]